MYFPKLIVLISKNKIRKQEKKNKIVRLHTETGKNEEKFVLQ